MAPLDTNNIPSPEKDNAADTWQQIANIKPTLRPDRQFYKHRYRNQTWFVLENRIKSQYFRFTPIAYRFLLLLDGNHTVAEILTKLSEQDPEKTPSQDDIIRTLITLNEADMLLGDIANNSETLLMRHRRHQQRKWQQRLMQPLALKFALLDPDSFLNHLLPAVSPLLSRNFFIIWFLTVLWGLLTALNMWPALIEHWQSRFFDPRNLFYLWLLYPIVKGLHELGHAFAAKKWGGEVHELGLLFLVLIPVPYVDASSATAFTKKQQRITVGAAGIMVELFLAAVAILLWENLETGTTKDILFNIAFIGGVSTILFNGNPLLRFDGYYVLADTIEIPNLGTRSKQYLAYLIKHYLFKLPHQHSPVTAQGERQWLLHYGVLAGIYRLLISFSIAFFISTKFFIVGLLLAIWFLFFQIVFPLTSALYQTATAAIKHNLGRRFFCISSGFSGLMITVLFFLPISHSTTTRGIITLPEEALVRAKVDGFVTNVIPLHGAPIQRGDPLFELGNMFLKTKQLELTAKKQELQAQYNDAFHYAKIQDRVHADIIKAELAVLQEDIDNLQAQINSLHIISPVDGHFSLAKASDLPGRFVRKGDVLGFVTNLSNVTARIVVPQASVDLVRRQTKTVAVKLISRPRETLTATLHREVPLATRQLPSSNLGTSGGGNIEVDARDKSGKKSINKIFQFDIALPALPPGSYLGQTVIVRIIHHRKPIGTRLYQQLRQLIRQKLYR